MAISNHDRTVHARCGTGGNRGVFGIPPHASHPRVLPSPASTGAYAMKFPILCAALLGLAGSSASATESLPLPHGRPVKVAFVLSERATVIDFAGPWEVFQDVMLDDHGDMVMPFELYTVAPAKTPLHTSGGTGH